MVKNRCIGVVKKIPRSLTRRFDYFVTTIEEGRGFLAMPIEVL